ncbi:MAG: flavin prenyltransferase UbiX [bacterium]
MPADHPAPVPAPHPAERIVLAMTGASGMVYAQRLLTRLLASGVDVHLIISRQGAAVAHEELGLGPEYFRQLPVTCPVTCHDYQDFSSPLASGSFHTQGMVIIPCSMNSLAAIARGLSIDLIHRAASVHLKERRKLIVVPRESPVSSVHLENMLILSREGAVIMPAMPAFYHHPQNLDDLVEHFVSRILDQIGQVSPRVEACARERRKEYGQGD